MATSLASTIRLYAAGTHISTPTNNIDDNVITDPFVLNFTDTMADGDADGMYHAQIVETGASETIHDLRDMDDKFGTSQAFSTVKFIMVRHVSGTATLIIGGTTTHEWFDTDMLFYVTDAQLFLPAGGVFVAYTPDTGWPVDNDSKDKFIINTSGTATYDIVIIGELA